MKGTTTDPCAIIIIPPNIKVTIIIGASHNFLYTLRIAQNSFTNSILLPFFRIGIKKSLIALA